MKRKRPQHLDTRIVRRFAILPIFTPTEWRWLCWVNVEQIYNEIWDDCTNGNTWGNVRFVDNESEFIKSIN